MTTQQTDNPLDRALAAATAVRVDDLVREANLHNNVTMLELDRDVALAKVAECAARHEAAVLAGDPEAAKAALTGLRRERASLTELETDLATANAWLADARAVVAQQRTEAAAAEAKADARAAFNTFTEVLNTVRDSVEARVEALADMVAAQQADYSALRAAKDAASAAAAKARGLAAEPEPAVDPIEQALDRALRTSAPLTRGWRVPPGLTAPAMLNAITEASRAEHVELR